MVDGRGLDKFMMKIDVVMGEVGKHGDKREKGIILTLVFWRSFGRRGLQGRDFCWRLFF